jgi:hypothetical protein
VPVSQRACPGSGGGADGPSSLGDAFVLSENLVRDVSETESDITLFISDLG